MLHATEKKHSDFSVELVPPKLTERGYIERRKARTALIYDLFNRPLEKIALISGAGIAGLATSLELRVRGFKVIIAEKRESFSRSNIINLNVEAQLFLKRFNFQQEFEESVAARISTHKTVMIEGLNRHKVLKSSDVSKLELGDVPFEPENFTKLFHTSGIYSVKIKDLQTFLAKKALDAGVHIYGNVSVKILNNIHTEGIVSKVEIVGNDNCNSIFLKPDIFFVAEGSHSTTAQKLGMEMNELENECSDENWIFGNVKYSGKENFVVSIIDTTDEKSIKLANVIFNSKVHEVNIAVTSENFLEPKDIEERIIEVAKLALDLENIDEKPQLLHPIIQRPVRVKNEKRATFSKDNVFLIGDTAGHSSPLAGLGGTLGLTLIPRTINQLLDDLEEKSDNVHRNFKIFTEAYISRWIDKSMTTKKSCLDIFKKEQQADEN